MAKPILRISGSEPHAIKNRLKDISIVDNKMLWPDYLITSEQGFTVGIARGTTNDILSNKVGIASHIAEELSKCNTDIKIFLHEEFMGANTNGEIVTKGGFIRQRNYVGVINIILSACIANNALWVPSATIRSTCDLLRNWNNSYFQQMEHKSLQIRPEKIEKIFGLKLNEDPFSFDNRMWWLSDIPGVNIGQKRAEDALLQHKSLMRLFMQPRNVLEMIPGWGKVASEKFRTFIDIE